MKKNRFYIDTFGNDDEAYREAIKYACKLADEDLEIKNVILLLLTKQNTGWFERLYGSQIVKDLFSGITFKDCKPLYKFETIRTYQDHYTPSEIVISCGLDSDTLFKVDNYHSAKAIIAIPWLREFIDKWVQTWSPVNLRNNQKPTLIFPEPSCIAQKAMIELTKNINMSSGLSHSSDENRAKTYIRSLYKYEPSLDANVVGSYLINKLNWKTTYAQEIEKLINILNQGKHFQGGQRTGLQHYYKSWKELCNSEEKRK